MTSSAADIAALERISTRVALTKEADLEAVRFYTVFPALLPLENLSLG